VFLSGGNILELDINIFMTVNIEDNGHEYKIVKYLGEGAIGYMFHCRNDELFDDRAVKFIPKNNLREGWENEITKVNRLKGHEKIVRYYTHGTITIVGLDFLYIMWEYIPNDSLKSLIERHEVTMPMLIEIIVSILEVLYACNIAHIIHADLHSGNILIQKENPLIMDATYRKVWITDFGYISQYSDKSYLDDFSGFNRIIQDVLSTFNFNLLDSEDKHTYRFLNDVFKRCLLETDPTVDPYAKKSDKLLELLRQNLNRKSKDKKEGYGGIGDYLIAEHLGDNFEEWKAIFVPKFIATNELLERNICILTGLRGCGKTMLFKRLSSYFNLMIGENANLEGSDSFYGFYLNSRDIAESFPWVPDVMENSSHNQIIYNFNLRWILEILIWIRELINNKIELSFLNHYFKQLYPEYFTINSDESVFFIIDLIKKELEKSRLHSKYEERYGPITKLNFLEEFVILIKEKLGLEKAKPFYFFLDDYSLPMVNSSTQKILNPIIFRRSSEIIFKVSTENVESFEPIGLNGKRLEENNDYRLINCGTMTFNKTIDECKDILFSIIQSRIERNSIFGNRKLTLEKILGETSLNNEERARKIRHEEIENDKNESVLYQGWQVFCNMWSSDIREMINIFADMVSNENSENIKGDLFPRITDKVQNNVYMESGGQFMALLRGATNPNLKNKNDSSISSKEKDYSNHLTEIIKAFHEIASYDLKNKTSKNLGKTTIKKARRIEVTSVENELTGPALDYYKGLIRYGVFIIDYRGKSVRGKIVPRLILRSSLIPYFKLTFSKRDSITMSWEEFNTFLLHPNKFLKLYKKESDSQQLLFE
jgi:serine/threonine protein kinase